MKRRMEEVLALKEQMERAKRAYLLPKEEQMALAHNKYPEVRRILAGETDLDVDVFEVLSKDRNWTVRRTLARNPNCPLHILEQLGTDPRPEVKIAVAWHLRTPVEIIRRLAADPDPLGRIHALASPKLEHGEAIKRLAKEKDQFVIVEAIKWRAIRTEEEN